jgi:hypothetical protein
MSNSAVMMCVGGRSLKDFANVGDAIQSTHADALISASTSTQWSTYNVHMTYLWGSNSPRTIALSSCHPTAHLCTALYSGTVPQSLNELVPVRSTIWSQSMAQSSKQAWVRVPRHAPCEIEQQTYARQLTDRLSRPGSRRHRASSPERWPGKRQIISWSLLIWGHIPILGRPRSRELLLGKQTLVLIDNRHPRPRYQSSCKHFDTRRLHSWDCPESILLALTQWHVSISKWCRLTSMIVNMHRKGA